ncbi:MAG: glycoside hydrolase family 15 protein [Candidatus Saccharimonadales bacterium]
MARPVLLSNGELHVGINSYGLVHDFYYPYVGLENHSAGEHLRHKIGIWVDGSISWLDDDPDWKFRFRYPIYALIGHTIAKNERLGVVLEFDDFVDSKMSAFIRNVHVVNLKNEDRDIRLFMHAAFAIGDSRSNTDTAQYLPQNHAILHYRGRRAFVISGARSNQEDSFDQYSVGLFGTEGHEGTWRDADDGELQGTNVEHGRVDSVLRFQLMLPAHSSDRVHYWVAAGMSKREALYIHQQIKKDGIYDRLQSTTDWWLEWLKPAIDVSKKLPEARQDALIRSAMIIRSQIDKRGAVMASTDTSMLNYSRDAYAYCWPRDGAYVLWPLIRMGYKDEPRRFFEFCRRGLHESGYLMHKYRSDGALGSSWHPYVHDGVYAPPIQEDETALVVFVFAQFHRVQNDPRLLSEFYESMIKPMSNFLATYIDDRTGLPKATYDLWEEVMLTTTYTVAVTHAALNAAAELAEAAGDSDSAVKWRLAAEDIYHASHKHLYNEERKAFYKGISFNKDGELFKDDTIDVSSFYGAFMFGLFPTDSEELKAVYQTIIDTFGEGEEIHGIQRYENDFYYRKGPDAPSNWWFICTLWLAQYHIEMGAPEKAEAIIDWVDTHASSTGIMSEQIDPQSNTRVGVEPLTWTHAEYLSALLDTIGEVS